MTKPVCLEYIWIGGHEELRSKTKVIHDEKNSMHLNDSKKATDFPEWNYDGSSTGQASGEDSEIVLKPAAIFKDPFRENGQLVLCETFTPDGTPHSTNKRNNAVQIFNSNLDAKPWYGLEQEYFILDGKTKQPLGYFGDDKTEPQGQYYCSVGTENAYGRKIAEEHLQCCIKAGIKISGINGEVAPGQWEFQIGPCEGIEEGDHLWVARYLLNRVAEKHGVIITFDPKPLKGEWNGSGCHTNFSTLNMRNGTEKHNGLYYIDEAITKLSKKHKEHMLVYGSGNQERMTGKHETADYHTFSDGIANRGCSIRRGNNTYNNKKGYFEDRRPSSTCDPYLVTSTIFKTIN